MERETTSDLSGGAYFLNFKAGTDARQRRAAEGQRLRVVRLESLVFPTKTEQDRVLEVWWKHNVLIAGLTWHLNAEVPWRKGYKGEGRWSTWACVLGDQVLICVRVKGRDSAAKVAGIADVLPGECRKRRTQRSYWCVDRLDQDRLSVKLFESVS